MQSAPFNDSLKGAPWRSSPGVIQRLKELERKTELFAQEAKQRRDALAIRLQLVLSDRSHDPKGAVRRSARQDDSPTGNRRLPG